MAQGGCRSHPDARIVPWKPTASLRAVAGPGGGQRGQNWRGHGRSRPSSSQGGAGWALTFLTFDILPLGSAAGRQGRLQAALPRRPARAGFAVHQTVFCIHCVSGRHARAAQGGAVPAWGSLPRLDAQGAATEARRRAVSGVRMMNGRLSLLQGRKRRVQLRGATPPCGRAAAAGTCTRAPSPLHPSRASPWLPSRLLPSHPDCALHPHAPQSTTCCMAAPVHGTHRAAALTTASGWGSPEVRLKRRGAAQ